MKRLLAALAFGLLFIPSVVLSEPYVEPIVEPVVELYEVSENVIETRTVEPIDFKEFPTEEEVIAELEIDTAPDTTTPDIPIPEPEIDHDDDYESFKIEVRERLIYLEHQVSLIE